MPEREPEYRPFDSIPSEILSHILSLVFEYYSDNLAPAKYRFPSIPCQVSRYFASTALSTPVLWSYVYFGEVRIDFAHIEERITRRTGALPLEIYFHLSTRSSQFHKQILGLVESCPTRWKSLCVEIYRLAPGNPWSPLLRLLRKPAPHLRSLSIIDQEPSDYSRSSDIPVTAIPLRYLRLHNCRFPFGKESLPNTLEELHISDSEPHYMALGPIAESLQSGSLRRLSLNDFSISSRGFIDNIGRIAGPSYIMESLEFLEVRGRVFAATTILLNAIHAPNLQHLSIQILPTSSPGPSTRDPLLKVWEELSFPKLTTLTLAAMNPPEGTLTGFLTNMPSSVKHLIIARENVWPVADLLMTLNDPKTSSFSSQLKRVSVSGLHLDTLFDWAKKALTSLELLELDSIDTTLRPDDRRFKDLMDQFEKLKTLPAKVRVVKWADSDGYEPYFWYGDPMTRSWSDVQSAKSLFRPLGEVDMEV